MRAFIVLYLGALAAVIFAYLVPQAHLLRWSNQLIPLILMLAFLSFWFGIIHLRKGLEVHSIKEGCIIALIMITTSGVLALFDLSIEERVSRVVIMCAFYTICWLADYSLQNEKGTVHPQGR